MCGPIDGNVGGQSYFFFAECGQSYLHTSNTELIHFCLSCDVEVSWTEAISCGTWNL